LLAINRQVRDEALSIYYGANVFEPWSSLNTENFLKLLGHDRIKLLKCVRAFTPCLPLMITDWKGVAWWLEYTARKLAEWQREWGAKVLREEAVCVPFLIKVVRLPFLVASGRWAWVAATAVHEWVPEQRDGYMVLRKREQ